MKDDYSLEATMGYIVNTLETKGPRNYQFFVANANSEDRNLMENALRELQSDDSVLRKGTMFYLPKR